jgi:hypothetical protein
MRPGISTLVLSLVLLMVPAVRSMAAEAAPDESLDDVLSGFEEEDDAFAAEPAGIVADAAQRFWDVDGRLSQSASINVLSHRSTSGTKYDSLQKWRTRLDLQVDLDLPRAWKGRVAGYGFYDVAYRLRGRDRYTNEVLDEYEWEVDFDEVYVQGSLTDALDLKLGRQVVDWGRSETLRVLDVLNPLDLREPGLADIEELRLPVAMVNASYYVGDWALTAIAIPEIRFDKLPGYGSDFFPFDAPLPGEGVPGQSFENVEWAARVLGIFHGWDVSLQFARVWDDEAHVTLAPVTEGATLPVRKHSRLTLVGAGGNYTLGSWLLKGELAYVDGADYTFGGAGDAAAIPQGALKKSRLDVMGGVEYYGFADTSIAADVLNRHVDGFDPRMSAFGAQENAVEMALRISADFWHERLSTELLAVIFGERAQDGSLVRLSADYELREALIVGGGLLLFQNGDLPEFTRIGRNDRVFAEVEYSF